MNSNENRKLIVAETLARVLIYGGIGAITIPLLGWIVVPGLLLSASEPWLDRGIVKAAGWMESPKAPAPIRFVMSKLNPLLAKAFGGNTWWTHVARFVPGLVVGAFFGAPAALSHSGIVTHFIDGIVGNGTFNTIWNAAISGLIFTALPKSTELLTTGLTKGFGGLAKAAAKLPVIGKPLSGLLQQITDLHVERVVGVIADQLPDSLGVAEQQPETALPSRPVADGPSQPSAQLRGVAVEGKNPVAAPQRPQPDRDLSL